jgi:RbcX protein
MYPKKVAEDSAKVLRSYLTYQAVKLIVEQLTETNPPQALWLTNYTSSHNIQDGEAYLDGLMDENKELVLRILTVRQDLADNILDLLPEMVKAIILQANIDHRRRLLERLTASPKPNDSPEQ